MAKRRSFNGILLAIVVIAALVLLLDDEKSPKTEAQLQRVSDLSTEDISIIRIERHELTNMEFQLENGKWMMTVPYEIKAADHRIQGILDLITSRSHHQLAVKDIDLSQLDLAQPAIRLNLNDAWFEFGSTNPLDEQRYLLYKDTIHLIHDTLYPQLSTNPTFFIETKLFDNDSGIKSISFDDETIKQNISGNWIYSADDSINSEVLKQRVLAWQSVSASSVQEAQGLSPLSSITFKFMDGEQIILDVISEMPHLILHKPASQIQYHINEFIAANLFPPIKPETEEIE